jgi:hypothetical protein
MPDDKGNAQAVRVEAQKAVAIKKINFQSVIVEN